MASSSARTCVGKMTLQEILDNRSMISAKVQEDLVEDLKTWGFSIRTFEIKEVTAHSRKVQEALKKQINAEVASKEAHIQADS
jgi:regulator of protease activity HflC (stomatin/prohibitin superfamily)